MLRLQLFSILRMGGTTIRASRKPTGLSFARTISSSSSRNLDAKDALARFDVDYSHTDYAKHWKIERYVTVAMLPLLPAAVACPGHFWLDSALCVGMILHGYWGVVGVATDYIASKSQTAYAAFRLFMMAIATAGLSGLLIFNSRDMGVSNALYHIWAL